MNQVEVEKKKVLLKRACLCPSDHRSQEQGKQNQRGTCVDLSSPRTLLKLQCVYASPGTLLKFTFWFSGSGPKILLSQ